MIATGHCRRRKIRCLLAPDDPQGRCSNCIRLKKECNFYPVEHNADNQRASGAVKDLSTGTLTTPVASSPQHLPPHQGEKFGDFRAPFHGGAVAGPNVPYDSEVDQHHTPTSSGGKTTFCEGSTSFAKLYSNCATCILPIPTSD